MIWGIHYCITKLKTKIDVIPRSCFKHTSFQITVEFNFHRLKVVSCYCDPQLQVGKITYILTISIKKIANLANLMLIYTSNFLFKKHIKSLKAAIDAIGTLTLKALNYFT